MLAKLENVNLTFFANTDIEVNALKNVSFSLAENEIVGVLGASGSSKSTFGQVLSGLVMPDKGSVFIDDVDIGKNKNKNLCNTISYLFQNPEKQLFENTIFDEIAFSLRNMRLTEDEIITRVTKSLQDVGLNYEQYWKKSPFNISGGEMRRVGIASSLALDSKAFVLDEPTAGLDQKSKKLIIELLLSFKSKKSIVLISHDLDEVFEICDRIIVFREGKIALECRTSEILTHFSLLESLKIKLPTEYEFRARLSECGIKIESFSSNEMIKLIEKRSNAK